MKAFLAAVAVIVLALAGAAQEAGRRSPFESTAAPAVRNRIDEIVFASLKKEGIRPARLSSDAVFVRRVYLDVIGTLPTADEARAFLEDRGPDKRSALIDRLLAREEYADYWAMKWSDVLRVKSEFPINLWPNAVQAYHRWIRSAIRDNVPYDRFARELLTASGSNFRDAPVNFYRAVQSRDPQAIASTVALTFMGARTDAWPKDRLAGMAAFFSQIGYKPTGEWKEEIVYFDPEKNAPAVDPASAGASARQADTKREAGPRTATLPDDTSVRLEPGQDPREAFASWLVAPDNPWFARAAVNRAWFWLVGRGIVHEPDDMRADNPPSHPELLAFLARELVAARFDMKQLHRLILNSSTYQLASVPASTPAAPESSFACALVRPLDAEVLIDALNQITGMGEEYSSAIPEPYTFIPPDQRSIALADGSIRSAFLETFGRPPRDTGLAAERTSQPTAAQRLYLLNSGDVQRKLQQGPRLQALLQRQGGPREVINALYLTILSRYPTDEELRAITEYSQAGGTSRRGVGQDLAWALINTAEFGFRH
jgi:hypothetical protein